MSQREEFEQTFPSPDWLVVHEGMYTISTALVGDVTYAVHSAAIQQARWEAWQAAIASTKRSVKDNKIVAELEGDH